MLPGGHALAGGATEFCLEGELDLGARYQGYQPAPGESYPTTWCIVTEADSDRVLFSGAGRSNPDMDGGWTVAYLPPGTVRIVNRESPPDVEFDGVDMLDEARRVRRVDPRRLATEMKSAESAPEGLDVVTVNDRVTRVITHADLPLRGRVEVRWDWDWTRPQQPRLTLNVDGVPLYVATGRWRSLSDAEAAAYWRRTAGAEPVQVPAEHWPARVAMQREDLGDGVYMVRGVRTGFRHLVVDSEHGLIVADAPAGWVEFHHLPPSDLVPGLGISGLSQQFIDYLREAFPKRPLHAVALTHFHDDHAGGARAFAAAGAKVYAPAASASFLETALNRRDMPRDRLTPRTLDVQPVSEPLDIGSDGGVRLLPMNGSPHVDAMLGVFVPGSRLLFVSDIHVPRSADATAPRPGRAAAECWFASWALDNLPPGTRVANSHSAPVTPLSVLAAYVESEICAPAVVTD